MHLWTIQKTSKPVFVWREDIAKKNNIPTTELTTIEGIDTFLRKIAKVGTNITPFDIGINGAGQKGYIIELLASKYEIEDLGFHGFYLDLNDPKHKILPMEQTKMFKEAVLLAKKWYDAGIISKEAITLSNKFLFENGKALSEKGTVGRLYEKTYFTDKAAVKGAIEMYPNNKYALDSPLNNAIAINKNAANPERTLMFMNLITKDQSVYDILMYGIKNETYTLDSQKVVGYTFGENPAKPFWQNWFNPGFLRANLQRPTVAISAEALKSETSYARRPNIVVSPLSGLVPNTSYIKTLIAKRDEVYEESGKLLLSGILKGDVDKAINEYIQKQKAAGLDKVVEELQKQVDEFVK